jgi:hypothetical protein
MRKARLSGPPPLPTLVIPANFQVAGVIGLILQRGTDNFRCAILAESEHTRARLSLPGTLNKTLLIQREPEFSMKLHVSRGERSLNPHRITNAR